MIPRSLTASTAASVLLVLSLAACGGHRPALSAIAEAPARTATMEDLLERVRVLGERASGAWTTRADLRFEQPALSRRHEVRLRLAGRKPAELRMQGTKPLLPTLFVLVANPEGVWLDVPTRKKTYFLPAGAELAAGSGAKQTLLSISPSELLSALSPDPPLSDEIWTLIEEPHRYVLAAWMRDGEHLRPSRELVFERSELRLVRQRQYDAQGRLTTSSDIGLRDSSSPLPASVRLERPFDDVILTFRFDESRRAPLPDSAFRYQLPAGRELIDVSRGARDLPTGLPGEDGERVH